MNRETTGDKIRKIRLEKGLTQKQLAEKCNMYESQIRKYETGKANPKLETMTRVATALEVDVSAIYSDSQIQMQKISQVVSSWMDHAEDEIKKEQNLLTMYRGLNPNGQNKAMEQIEMLTKIPEYQNSPLDEQPTDNSPE